MAAGMGLPIAISFPGHTPSWAAAASPRDLVRLVQAGDRLGYRYTTVSDHIAVPRRAVAAMGGTWYAPLPTLAFVAAVTERLGLCTHVLVLPYRHPLQVARDAGTIDHLSGGRLILGVGTGHLRAEFSALGLDHDRRGDVTDACLAELERIWAGDSDLVVLPGPAQTPRPRIWIGGNSARSLRRAHEHGDGWVPWLIEPERMRQLLETHGHPGEVVYPATFDPLGRDGPAQPADACLEQLALLRAAGVTAVTTGFPSASLDEHIAQLEAFATEVMPRAASMG
jgi:probable F420-dependent oxidoreductase